MNYTADEVKVNSTGVKIKLNAGEDISSASPLQMMIEQPNGTIITVTATVEDTNYFIYTTTSNDGSSGDTIFNQTGYYFAIGYMTLGTFVGYTETLRIKVVSEFG